MENLALEISKIVETMPKRKQQTVYRYVQEVMNTPIVEFEMSGADSFKELERILHKSEIKPINDFEKEREEYLYEKYISLG
ncbi:MAG: hypothetical protein FWG68_05365 [Defluviitaleaceae bacterium]|nr:hypothetical protein [Defluviitaleaceae bacterium]